MPPIIENLGTDKIQSFFITHLDRIYSAKSHLIKHLPEMEDLANFTDLQNAISTTRKEVKKQISRMHEIYGLLNAKMSVESHKGLIGMVEDAFSAIKQQKTDPALRDMSMLFYLQNIESVEMTSFQMLQIAAVKLRNQQIKQLLQQNFESAKADKALLQMLTVKYITG
jgi:ferritin-like metal-binding protein YciE